MQVAEAQKQELEKRLQEAQGETEAVRGELIQAGEALRAAEGRCQDLGRQLATVQARLFTRMLIVGHGELV